MKNSIALYILTSVLTVVFFPIACWGIPLLNLLMINVATIPVKLAAHMIGFPELVKIDMFAMVPSGKAGFVLAVIVWVILGIIIGIFIFKLRELSAFKKGLETPPPGSSVVISSIAFQILISIICFIIMGTSGIL